MDNPPPPALPQPPQLLYGIVWKKVTYRQQGSLETVFPYFTQELQYELQSLYAMDDNTTTTIVNRWITNLNVIESGLNSFSNKSIDPKNPSPHWQPLQALLPQRNHTTVLALGEY